MFKDSLQKKLLNMEKENSSTSLKDVKPNLDETMNFLGRYISRLVEKVTQVNSVYGSDQDRRKDYEKRKEWHIRDHELTFGPNDYGLAFHTLP